MRMAVTIVMITGKKNEVNHDDDYDVANVAEDVDDGDHRVW